MKRVLMCLLALCVLTLSLAPVGYAAETGEPAAVREPGHCGENMTWVLQDGILTITGTGPMDDFPDGPQWAEHKEDIRKVVLSGNISTVGANAFTDYDKLTEVDFGKALQEIGTGAFKDCDGLTAISLPDPFRRFGEESFMNCPNLKEIHCEGGFPSFNLNCLWNTWAKIYFPAERPWGVTYIQQLEEAFKGRIEFLASDGSDPYVPTEPTEATEAPIETTAPTQAATEPTVPPVLGPVAEPTDPPVTQGATEPPVVEVQTQPTQAPQPEQPQPEVPDVPVEEPTGEESFEEELEEKVKGGFGGLAIVSGVMCLLIIGALIFRGRKF